MALVTEGLGPKKCHGRIVILINENDQRRRDGLRVRRERGLATL